MSVKGEETLDPASRLDEAIRGLRVVWLGLLAGLAMMLGVVLFLGPIGGDGSLTVPLLAVFGLLVTSSFAAAFVLDRAFVTRIAARAPELRSLADPLAPVLGEYRGHSIVMLGLAEGPGLFCGPGYLVTGSPFFLAGGVLAFAVLLSRMPSEGGLRRSVERAIGAA